MNKGRHMSYQCRIGNMKGGSDTVRSRPWLDYRTPLQCLLYKEPKGEGRKNKIYLGRFPCLQGRLAPQASHTQYIFWHFQMLVSYIASNPADNQKTSLKNTIRTTFPELKTPQDQKKAILAQFDTILAFKKLGLTAFSDPLIPLTVFLKNLVHAPCS